MEWTGFVFYHLEILQIEQNTCYFQKLEIKDYTVVVHEINVFDQPVKNNIKIYGSIRKILLVKEIIAQLVVYLISNKIV